MDRISLGRTVNRLQETTTPDLTLLPALPERNIQAVLVKRQMCIVLVQLDCQSPGVQHAQHTFPFARRRPAQRAVRHPDRNGLKPAYDANWAVVVGIDNYQHLSKLRYAVSDAAGMTTLLVGQHGFCRDKLLVVLDPPSPAPYWSNSKYGGGLSTNLP